MYDNMYYRQFAVEAVLVKTSTAVEVHDHVYVRLLVSLMQYQ